MKKLTLILLLAFTTTASAGWFSTKTEDQALHDDMVSCFKTIIETGDGICSLGVIDKASRFNRELVVDNPLTDEEYEIIVSALSLVHTCLTFNIEHKLDPANCVLKLEKPIKAIQ